MVCAVDGIVCIVSADGVLGPRPASYYGRQAFEQVVYSSDRTLLLVVFDRNEIFQRHGTVLYIL